MGKHAEVTRGSGMPESRSSVSRRSQVTATRPSPPRGISAKATMPVSRGFRGRPLFIGTFVMIIGVLLVNVIDPYSGALASPYYQVAPVYTQGTQGIQLSGNYAANTARDAYSITARTVEAAAAASAPPAGVPDPDSAQAIALSIVSSKGWGADQYNCLVSLWNRESHWNVYAHNSSSGAYGIPQALPGDKMATAGADWATNPATQILWGLGYIEGRYGSPCGAWAHSENMGWY